MLQQTQKTEQSSRNYRCFHLPGYLVLHGSNLLGRLLGAVEELEEVLQVAGRLVLDVALGAAGGVEVPAERGLVAVELALLAHQELAPGLEDGGLVQQAVDDVGVHPVVLGAAGFEVLGDMLVVLLQLAVHSGAEAATPSPPLHHVLDDGVRVRARLAAVGRLVVLVEGVGAPEALVAVGARVLAPALVELLLVPFPVELALERLVARRAPVAGLGHDRRRAAAKGPADGRHGALARGIGEDRVVAGAGRGRRGDGRSDLVRWHKVVVGDGESRRCLGYVLSNMVGMARGSGRRLGGGARTFNGRVLLLSRRRLRRLLLLLLGRRDLLQRLRRVVLRLQLVQLLLGVL